MTKLDYLFVYVGQQPSSALWTFAFALRLLYIKETDIPDLHIVNNFVFGTASRGRLAAFLWNVTFHLLVILVHVSIIQEL